MSTKLFKPLTLNTTALQVLFACLCFVFTHSYVLAHDITHQGHEQTELCDVLKTLGGQKDCINTQGNLLFLPAGQNHALVWLTPSVNRSVVVNQRSRAPPHSLL